MGIFIASATLVAACWFGLWLWRRYNPQLDQTLAQRICHLEHDLDRLRRLVAGDVIDLMDEIREVRRRVAKLEQKTAGQVASLGEMVVEEIEP